MLQLHMVAFVGNGSSVVVDSQWFVDQTLKAGAVWRSDRLGCLLLTWPSESVVSAAANQRVLGSLCGSTCRVDQLSPIESLHTIDEFTPSRVK
jgi:hypothetical protein